MTEIQKTRESKNPTPWEKWLTSAVAIALLSSAIIQAPFPNHQIGAIASVVLFVLVYLSAYRVAERRLHKELVQELDAVRRELEQLKAAH
jgi:sensor domain CHASE-containing protein